MVVTAIHLPNNFKILGYHRLDITKMSKIRHMACHTDLVSGKQVESRLGRSKLSLKYVTLNLSYLASHEHIYMSFAIYRGVPPD